MAWQHVTHIIKLKVVFQIGTYPKSAFADKRDQTFCSRILHVQNDMKLEICSFVMNFTCGTEW